ncbi:MAG: aminopeptidase [Nanoarchaeota archaeon]
MGELQRGAGEAIKKCLNLKEGEKIVIITDLETLEIATALMEEAKALTDKITFFIAEDFEKRPLKNVPQKILDSISDSNVGILAMQGKVGELENFRRPLLQKATESNLRFANMINITHKIMEEGMNANYNEIGNLSNKLYSLLKDAKEIQVKTRAGTNFTARFSKSIDWVISDGHIKEGNWKNLPDGEVFTCPYTVDGKVVIDGVLGDYFSKKYGLLDSSPLYLKIKDGKVKEVKCKNSSLQKEFLEKISTDENASRIGEFAIGTNKYIKELIGNMLQDEKFPGVHIAVGNGHPEKTGSDCHSAIHIDGVIRKPDVIVDNQLIMRAGGFLI